MKQTRQSRNRYRYRYRSLLVVSIPIWVARLHLSGKVDYPIVHVHMLPVLRHSNGHRRSKAWVMDLLEDV